MAKKRTSNMITTVPLVSKISSTRGTISLETFAIPLTSTKVSEVVMNSIGYTPSKDQNSVAKMVEIEATSSKAKLENLRKITKVSVYFRYVFKYSFLIKIETILGPPNDVETNSKINDTSCNLCNSFP